MEKLKISLLLILFSCASESNTELNEELANPVNEITQIPLTNGFDYPVGKPNAEGYYKALNFQESQHLGEDWNGLGGGDTDLGDPVYAVSKGFVYMSKDYKRGWGNVVRIIHQLDSNKQIESLYAHLDAIMVDSGVLVEKGQQIGTIGNAHGKYKAHLHFEIRDIIKQSVGAGYGLDTFGYINPTEFIKNHR